MENKTEVCLVGLRFPVGVYFQVFVNYISLLAVIYMGDFMGRPWAMSQRCKNLIIKYIEDFLHQCCCSVWLYWGALLTVTQCRSSASSTCVSRREYSWSISFSHPFWQMAIDNACFLTAYSNWNREKIPLIVIRQTICKKLNYLYLSGFEEVQLFWLSINIPSEICNVFFTVYVLKNIGLNLGKRLPKNMRKRCSSWLYCWWYQVYFF